MAGTGGMAGAGAAGGEGGDVGVVDGLAPVVRVTSPAALADPDDGNVIVAEQIDVVCEARQSTAAGAFPVEPSTVVIELLDAEGSVLATLPADRRADDSDEYLAEVVLTPVTDNGRVGFRCSASDGQAPALTSTDTVYSLIDHGPSIEVESPEEGDAFAVKTGVDFDFTVSPDPVADGDDAAAVDEVMLVVNGREIELPEPDDGRYRFSVDLNDERVFPELPDGEVPITILAKNRREPKAAERLLSYPIVIDGEGPVVTVATPQDEDVVGGFVKVIFTVEDELSEIDLDSVTVKVNLESFRYDPGNARWKRDGSNFTFEFDSTKLEGEVAVNALINVYADDVVGNSSGGESILVFFDNQAPIIDLDPANVREFKDTDPIECSRSFDPVGYTAPNDRQVVSRVARFRALVWERTNTTQDQTVILYSGTLEDSARIYIKRNAEDPLLIDSNEDGVCDQLEVDPDEDGEMMNFVRLKPIPASGSAWYGPEPDPDAAPTNANCTYGEGDEPQTLCDDRSDLHRAIYQPLESRPAAIYAIGDLGPGDACSGIDWEFGSLSQEGWLCFAATVRDNAGNVGLSRPLRLCYDNPNTESVPDCVTDDTPPACTDGCALPPAFEGAIIEN